MQNLRKKLQLEAGRLHVFTIAGHNLKCLPVYERGGKALESMFKTYKYSIPEGKYPVVEPTLNDIAKLLTMHFN